MRSYKHLSCEDPHPALELSWRRVDMLQGVYRLLRRVRIGTSDPSVARSAGMAAVTELVHPLAGADALAKRRR